MILEIVLETGRLTRRRPNGSPKEREVEASSGHRVEIKNPEPFFITLCVRLRTGGNAPEENILAVMNG